MRKARFTTFWDKSRDEASGVRPKYHEPCTVFELTAKHNREEAHTNDVDTSTDIMVLYIQYKG